MDCCSDNQTITIYKGFPTHFNNSPLINVSFDTTIDLTGFSAIFRIGETEKTYTDIADGFSIDLTKEETGALPVGLNYGELIVVDNETHKKPFTTALPFDVKTFVSGDIHLDNYNVNVTTKIKSVPLTIKIETATIDSTIIEQYISEHNLDEESHPYILGELDKKVDKVSEADKVYGTDGEGNQTTYDIGSFGQVDDVQVGGVSVVQNKIASLGTMAGESASDYRTASDQDTIDTGLSDRIDDIKDTIDTYGDIVTHNVSEFATSAQGALADSALQPSDVVNSTSSTAIDKPLSANIGKSLQDQVDNLKARGRFLALWNCATGLAESNPPESPYTYQAGDYFIIGVVAQSGGTNYKPEGSTYTTGVASTTVETQPVDVDDVYYFDGEVWRLQVNTQKTVSFVNIAGSPYDNTNLAGALNSKQDEITSQNKLSSDLVDDTNQTNKFVTAQEKTTWNNKQNAIDDLATIRSGASAGATAVQPSQLGTAAYQPTTAFATSAQGVKADSAIQGVKLNGTELNPDANKKVNVQVPTNNNQLTNGAGYITGITSAMVTTALGYTPYNSTNPSGYQANVIEKVKVNGTELTPSSKAVDITVPTNNNQLTNGAGYITSSSLNGYATQTWVGQQGYITGITSSDVTTALGYTPYNSTNPDGYTSNVGTVTSVNNVQPVNGNVSLTIPTVNNATLKIQKNGTDVATFTANSSTNSTANITVPTDTGDLTNGAGFITGITSSDVTSALGYTPIQYAMVIEDYTA